MIIDKQEHRDFLLGLLNGAQIPGRLLELATEVKEAIKTAEITPSIPAQNEAVRDVEKRFNSARNSEI